MKARSPIHRQRQRTAGLRRNQRHILLLPGRESASAERSSPPDPRYVAVHDFRLDRALPSSGDLLIRCTFVLGRLERRHQRSLCDHGALYRRAERRQPVGAPHFRLWKRHPSWTEPGWRRFRWLCRSRWRRRGPPLDTLPFLNDSLRGILMGGLMILRDAALLSNISLLLLSLFYLPHHKHIHAL